MTNSRSRSAPAKAQLVMLLAGSMIERSSVPSGRKRLIRAPRPMRDPQPPFGIGRHPVRIAPLLLKSKEYALSADRPVIGQIEGIDRADAAIRMIERLPVGTEGRAVRHLIAVVLP